jgi:uncharacterized protein
MLLEGVVTNVAAFGAFVDVGVHQDGLVHVSAMSRSYVSNPRDVVKPGDVVRVKVLDVDLPRKRISLTLRLDDPAEGERQGRATGDAPGGRGRGRDRGERGSPARRDRDTPAGGAMADALRRAGLAGPEGRDRRGGPGRGR